MKLTSVMVFSQFQYRLVLNELRLSIPLPVPLLTSRVYCCLTGFQSLQFFIFNLLIFNLLPSKSTFSLVCHFYYITYHALCVFLLVMLYIDWIWFLGIGFICFLHILTCATKVWSLNIDSAGVKHTPMGMLEKDESR